jgi:transcriptional regulator with XRE-family HTH domain
MNKIEIAEEMAHAIKYARSKAGITQVELAEAVGMSIHTIRGIEARYNSATLVTYKAIADACGVPLHEMIAMWEGK